MARWYHETHRLHGCILWNWKVFLLDKYCTKFQIFDTIIASTISTFLDLNVNGFVLKTHKCFSKASSELYCEIQSKRQKIANIYKPLRIYRHIHACLVRPIFRDASCTYELIKIQTLLCFTKNIPLQTPARLKQSKPWHVTISNALLFKLLDAQFLKVRTH